ncbi:MAG: MerR family transcriptional regulator [Oscillospiraceae bacterium]|nr:MerR family transcriptional regulator [Oscillospiraceae bacterium]
MEQTYNLNELAIMTGFTTRTLRNYLNQGLLHGEKVDGVWQFSAEEVDRFFKEPFVKEGLRIKRNAAVFDFLADTAKQANRACVILDLPVSDEEGAAVSAFFCKKMMHASNAAFTYHRDRGMSRVILTGAEDQVAEILRDYYTG